MAGVRDGGAPAGVPGPARTARVPFPRACGAGPVPPRAGRGPDGPAAHGRTAENMRTTAGGLRAGRAGARTRAVSGTGADPLADHEA